jgi:hypothetical protein
LLAFNEIDRIKQVFIDRAVFLVMQFTLSYAGSTDFDLRRVLNMRCRF